MARNVCTHLMFDRKAEEAMNLYVSLFPESAVVEAVRYEEGDNKGKLQLGRFTLGGRDFICIDSPVKQEFEFTPAMSIFVDCEDEEELQRVFESLSEGGEVLMPLDDYDFSVRFAWVNDRFGLSWQLNLPFPDG